MDDRTIGRGFTDSVAPGWVDDFPGLREVGDPTWIDVARGAREVTMPSGHRVFREGDPCQQYILVIDGATRVFKSFETGREMVLYRLQAGQTCILTTSVLLAGGLYPADAMTDARTVAMLVPARDFHHAFDQSKGFRDYVCSSFGGRMRDLIMLLESVVVRQVDVRLARWLLTNDKGEPIVASHRELAYELGTAREVISRQLKDFEKQGWVDLGRKHIAVRDAAALGKVVTGA